MTLPVVQPTLALPAVATFDYAALASGVASSLRAQAERIRKRIAKSTAEIIDIGRDLIAAKQHLDHGQFIKWVESEIGINARAAQRCMGAAALCDKNDSVSLLPPMTVCRLAAKSAPPKIVAAVTAKAAAGEVVADRVVAQLLADARDERLAAKREAEREQREAKRAKRRTKAAREQEVRHRLECEQRRRHERDQVVAATATLIKKLGVDGAGFILNVMAGVKTYASAGDVLDELKKQLAAYQGSERSAP